MFWSSLATSSAVDLALEQPEVTLENILALDEVLQELRAGNKKLAEFLIRPDNLNAMLDLITKSPDDTLPMAKQFQFPNISCEILTSDVAFGEKIAADRSCLDKIFNFFKNPPESCNPILASYVCRVISDIITRKPDQNWYSYQLNIIQLLGFLNENGAELLDSMLAHIGTSACCDLFVKLIMNLEGPDMKGNLLDWLMKEQFVERLVRKMSGEETRDHEGVHRLIVDLLAAFRDDWSSNADSNVLFLALRSPATIRSLFDVILGASDSVQPSSIKYGLHSVVALLGIVDTEQRPSHKSWVPITRSMDDIVLESEVKDILLTRFKDLGLLLKKEPTELLTLASGPVVARVGTMRLAVIEFFAHIVSLRKTEFLDEMATVGILADIMDLFWKNTTNGFMHRAVEKIVTDILNAPEHNKAIDFLFFEEALLTKILATFIVSNTDCKTRGLPYRGILARISLALSNLSKGDVIGPTLAEFSKRTWENDEWQTFVEDTLEDYLKKQKLHLANIATPTSGGRMQAVDDLELKWDDISSGGGFDDLSNNVDFDVFSGTDRFDDNNHSKSLFEAFCSERSNGLNEDDDLNINLNDEDKFDGCPQEEVA